MPIRIFVLKFDGDRGFSDDETVNRFLVGRKLLDLRKEFFLVDGHPYWSVFIEYEEIIPDKTEKPAPGINEWQALFLHKLKEWRKKKAEEAGIPPFLVATNG